MASMDGLKSKRKIINYVSILAVLLTVTWFIFTRNTLAYNQILTGTIKPLKQSKLRLFQETTGNITEKTFTCQQNGGANDNSPGCSIVIYNRVPKCGSRTMLSIMHSLSEPLNFTYISAEPPPSRRNYYYKEELGSFVKNFTRYPAPMIYTQHVHYVDFTRFQHENPIYINVVRDPVERTISHYYYRKYGSANKPKNITEQHIQSLDECIEEDGQKCLMNAVIPYFCGHESECRHMSKTALQLAMKNAEKHFHVIGLTEDLRSVLEVLEFSLPQFFSNATQVYDANAAAASNRTSTVNKPSVAVATKDKLRVLLELEYEFYNFAQQRFQRQLLEVRKAKANTEATTTMHRQ